MQKIPVTILGATGMVGQKLIELLLGHPLFEIDTLAASYSSAGKKLKECVSLEKQQRWPVEILEKVISNCSQKFSSTLIFSALSSKVAFEIETALLEKGYHIISNAKNYRTHPKVPLLIPEINPSHIQLIRSQPWPGKIITNPNCVVSALAPAIYPLFKTFGIERLHVCTLQAISGAGYDHIPENLSSNIIPDIFDEESKVETEPFKIFGPVDNEAILKAPFSISAQCNRVPVLNGHFMNVSVKLKKKPSLEEVKKAWLEFEFGKYSNPLIYFDEIDRPQPKIDHALGMKIGIGKLQHCAAFDFKFNIFADNLIRGAAGAALLNAEHLVHSFPSLISRRDIFVS